MKNHVTILAGVSGAGKSTYGRTLGGIMVSADDHFLIDGKYRFDPNQLQTAHDRCYRRYINLLCDNTPHVIVDNTNTTLAEITPYTLGAGAFGYTYELVIISVPPHLVDQIASRCIHSVPAKTIHAQAIRLAALTPDRRWNVRTIPAWSPTGH